MRFKTDYMSVFKILKKTYKQDCNNIKALLITPVMDTDWKQIVSSLVWTNKFKEYIICYNLSKEFQLKIVTEDITISKANELSAYIDSFHQNISADINWFNNLFDVAYRENASLGKYFLCTLWWKNCFNLIHKPLY